MKRRVLLVVTGCVQAEVTPRLIYNLLKNRALPPLDLNVVATKAAIGFFSKKKAEKILKKKIFVQHTDSNRAFPVPHIGLPEWAELILVYPASANTLAKCAHGITDSLATNIVLAAKCPVYFGPTMNDAMYTNPITRNNIRILKKVGHRFIPKELTPTKVRSTGLTTTKLYVSERKVLQTCALFLSRKK